MTMHRRKFLGTAAVGGLLAGLPAASWAADAFAGLPNLAKDAQPIGVAEHKARLAKATALLRAKEMDALLIETGASLIYFNGVKWCGSERDRQRTRLNSSH